MFPLTKGSKISPNDPMLITLGDSEEQSGSAKKSSGGIPGLDLVPADGAPVDKLPDNAPPPKVDLKETIKPITTPDSDKPFIDPKTAEAIKSTGKVEDKDSKSKKELPWHADNFFDDVPVGEVEVENVPSSDQDYRETPGGKEWPQEEATAAAGWQEEDFGRNDQDERRMPGEYDEEPPFQDESMGKIFFFRIFLLV